MKEQRLATKKNSGVNLFFNQIKHIYQVLTKAGIAPQKALDNICLGSDFDGFIEPIKGVVTAEDLRFNPNEHDPNEPKLDKDLTKMIKDHYFIFRKSGLDAEEIVQKILQINVMNFLKKYWN